MVTSVLCSQVSSLPPVCAFILSCLGFTIPTFQPFAPVDFASKFANSCPRAFRSSIFTEDTRRFEPKTLMLAGMGFTYNVLHRGRRHRNKDSLELHVTIMPLYRIHLHVRPPSATTALMALGSLMAHPTDISMQLVQQTTPTAADTCRHNLSAHAITPT